MMELRAELKALIDKGKDLADRWARLRDETPDYEEKTYDLGFFRLQKNYEEALARKEEAFDRIRYEGISAHTIELYRRSWADLDAAADEQMAYCRSHPLSEASS